MKPDLIVEEIEIGSRGVAPWEIAAGDRTQIVANALRSRPYTVANLISDMDRRLMVLGTAQCAQDVRLTIRALAAVAAWVPFATVTGYGIR